MAKIERKTQKIFAGEAGNDELAVFGSMTTGNPIYTDDIENLQSDDYEKGWSSAIAANEAPFLEEMNGVQYGFSKQLAYLLQEGIPEYDAGTTYYKGSVVKDLDEEGVLSLYRSLTDDNLGNSVTSTENWELFFSSAEIGDLNDLVTSDKSNLVAAINEAAASGGSGSGFEVGDIGIALYVDETKGLRRRLNGTTVAINANTQGFLKFLKGLQSTTPSLFTDEATWQTEATTNVDGCVYKFVIDESAGTIRLPKYPDYIGITADNISVIGNGLAMGLTDGSLNLGLGFQQYMAGPYGIYGFSGAQNLYGQDVGGKSGTGFGSTPGAGIGLTPDPDKSGIVAKLADSTTKLKMLYFIQIATGASESVDIENKIELNNPYTLFDYKYSENALYNASWLLSNGTYYPKGTYVTAYEALEVEQNPEIEAGSTQQLPSGTSYVKRGLSVKLSTESYTDTDFVLNKSNETFRLPLKTVQAPLIAKEVPVIGNGMTIGLTDGTNNAGLFAFNQSTTHFLTDFQTAYGSNVGTTDATGHLSGSASVGVTTDPTKSGLIADLSKATVAELNLYFYVGEIIQNANLIDAGRIQEQISELNSKPHIIETYQKDSSGYRIYSDGWCEQYLKPTPTANGDMELSLLKRYKDTYFSVVAMPSDNYNGNYDGWAATIKDPQTILFTSGYGTTVPYWIQTAGYLQEGEY